MDPCPFVRLTVGNLALKIPVATKPARTVVHPSSSPCFCKIKLKNFPLQTAAVPYIPPETAFPDGEANAVAATFHLSKSDLHRMFCLQISIYTGRRGTSCGVGAGRLLGKVSVAVELAGTEAKARVFHSGWVSVGGGEAKGSSAQFHLNVKAEPDPRFVFEFDGEPECSPQVFQIQGNIRQPVFTCNFTTADRNHRSRWVQCEAERERKGWSITVHDLSGSPVAAASMLTPFVPSPGSDRVSRSNPGSWLILRPAGVDGTWKPWGRLEAWRDRGGSSSDTLLGFRFELAPHGPGIVLLAESAISAGRGGKFVIDLGGGGDCEPALGLGRGFVMSARVEGEGRCSRPTVEVGVQHVTCAEDAAAFVALSAAVDLSVDACRLFSDRLRKELCHRHQDSLR